MVVESQTNAAATTTSRGLDAPDGVVAVLQRLDLVWAHRGRPAGRRPVCILTKNAAIPVLNAVVCAPLTRRIRGIASEVVIDAESGLGVECAVSCDALLTVPKNALDAEAVGHLSPAQAHDLERALR